MLRHIVKFLKLTERALNEFCEFFEHYPSNENIIKDIEKNPEKNLNFVADLKYTEKDIKLPDLKLQFNIFNIFNFIIFHIFPIKQLRNILNPTIINNSNNISSFRNTINNIIIFI